MTHSSTRHRIVAAALAGVLGLHAIGAAAIDGTGGSTPVPVDACELHMATPLHTATPSVGATPVTIATEPASSTAIASPDASAATPITSSTSDPLQADLSAAASSILTCMSENNTDILTQITGPDFRGEWLGVGMPLGDEDFASILPMMPRIPYALVAVADIESDGLTARATVVYTVGKQVMTSRWTLSRAEASGVQVWRVDAATPSPTEVPADAVVLELTIKDGSFRFSPDKVAGTDVVLQVTNSGTEVHEVLILRTPSTMTVADIVASPTGLPEGTSFIAQATVPAGKSGTIVLIGLRPGTYTVVDLLPDETGMPNASNGMFSTFKVTE